MPLVSLGQQNTVRSRTSNNNNNNNNEPQSPTSGRISYIKGPEKSAYDKSTTKVALPPISGSPTNNNSSQNGSKTVFISPSPPKNEPRSPQGKSINNNHHSSPLISQVQAAASTSSANSSSFSHPNGNNSQQQQRQNNINYPKRIAPIKVLIRERKEFNKAIELLDELIGSPTYADLPMFDESHPSPPNYENKVLFELLALRIECWMSLNQYGRVLDDITNAMRVDLQIALLKADFVVPKLKSLYDLGDIAVGLQVATSLELAVTRNGSLLEEVTEWKRKFVLAGRKKNEVVESNHHGIVIGGRKFAAGAPSCRHGCPDKEPRTFFEMEIVVNEMPSHGDTFLALYRLYTEFDGARLSWKHWARQELRKAIDAAANENWKQCRDSTRQYLIAQEFDKNGEAFIDSMDTLGRVPNPLQVDTTARFFKSYDRVMSTVDDLVTLLVEISKPFCSCMNEIHELRSRRIKTQHNNNTNTTETGNTRKGVTLTATLSSNNNNDNENQQYLESTAAVVPTVPAPSVSAQMMKVKANIREAANFREEGNLLFLGRKFRSALKCYDEAIELDPANTELLFNRTAALYELGEYDAVISACDLTMEHASKHSSHSTDKTFAAKVIARRGDALWKMGALEEAIWSYQESLDSWDAPAIRSKMIDVSIDLGKKKLAIAHGTGASSSSSSSQQQQQQKTQGEGGDDDGKAEQQEPSIIEKIINPKPATEPPVPFASCVIVEPMSSTNLTKTRVGHIPITVFPTQLATASHFFAEAIPIPLMKFANFPFAVVPCSSLNNHNQHQNSDDTTMTTTTTIRTHHHNQLPASSSSQTDSPENFFATLATRSLASDLSDHAPMSSPHHRSDVWFNCGSVIVLRKDFRPVTCSQVVKLFEFLAELWGFTASTEEDEQRLAKKNRLEVFSDVGVSRKRLAEKLGKMIDEDGTWVNEDEDNEDEDEEQNENGTTKNNKKQEDEEDNQLLAGTHVINTYSRKEELVRHTKERDLQQAKMLKEQGNKLYKGRRFRTALLRYDEGLMLDPQNPELLYNRAAALLELSMFEIAVDSCNRALDAVLHSDISVEEVKVLQKKIRQRKNLALKKLGKFDQLVMTELPDKSRRIDRKVLQNDDNDDEEGEIENENEDTVGNNNNNNNNAENNNAEDIAE